MNHSHDTKRKWQSRDLRARASRAAARMMAAVRDAPAQSLVIMETSLTPFAPDGRYQTWDRIYADREESGRVRGQGFPQSLELPESIQERWQGTVRRARGLRGRCPDLQRQKYRLAEG